MRLRIMDLGFCDYEKAYEIQLEMLERVQAGDDDTLILVEHPKVITLGRNTNPANLLVTPEGMADMGYAVKQIERGGDVTYHGPGQLVGYMIFNLKKNHPEGIRCFVEQIEALFIDYLGVAHGILAQRDAINSGVFIGQEKIVAIGLAVKRGVTMHGFAFNVSTNLEDFRVIVPCGLSDRGVTNLVVQLGESIALEAVKKELGKQFGNRFAYEDVIWETKNGVV